MATVTIAACVEALQKLPLLAPDQLAQVGALQKQFADTKALAEELIRRGWLTAFQASQLAAGKGDTLVLDQFVLLDLLGKGGMGAVYKAHPTGTDCLVAIKIIRREALGSAGSIERFQREGREGAKLNHPNVVTVIAAHASQGRPFLVMEFIEGTDLAKLVEKQGPLPVAQACEYIYQSACGLAHVHEQKLIHRDIKPHNLMLTKQGIVKVMDLGLARTVHSAEESAASEGLTGTGALVGTADYLAPEQAQDAKRVDIRADIYSLGCTLYHLLAGKPPFAGGTLVNKIAAHMSKEPEAIEEKRPDVPPELAAVLRKMMAKQPEQRYTTPAEVAQVLQPIAVRNTPSEVKSAIAPVPPSPAATIGTYRKRMRAAEDGTETLLRPATPRAPQRTRAWLALFVGVGFVATLAGMMLALMLSPSDDTSPRADGTTTANGVTAPTDTPRTALPPETQLKSTPVVDPKTETEPTKNPEPKKDPVKDPEPKKDPETKNPSDPDPLKDKLAKAKTEYQDEVANLRHQLLDKLDKAEQAARLGGNKQIIDRIKVERTAFEQEGTLPTVVATAEYEQKLTKARNVALAVFKAAIAEYSKAKKDAEAVALQKDPTFVDISRFDTVDLLALVDPAKDAVLGAWSFQGKTLVPANYRGGSRLQIPYIPPEEYALTIVAEHKEGGNGFTIGPVIGGRQCRITLDALPKSGFRTALESLDGKNAANNVTTYKGRVLKDVGTCEIICLVRKAGVRVTVDGKTIIWYNGDPRRLQLDPGWRVPNPNALFIGAWSCVFHFTKMELTPISGPGKWLER